LLRELEKRGASSVLVEGGGKLNYSSIAEGVVDEIVVTITPIISGNTRAASLADGPVDSRLPFIILELLSCRVGNSGEIFARYKIRQNTS
ncbi:MAG: dihydrofolate reductase family protein, partial [Desulfobacterales bacterium]|nr:dihydrofolate reductase family protein [Desulfobacterales bacterium]